MSGSPGPALLWTKLAVPAPRPGLIPRADPGSPLFLVLDDYHLITNPACHRSVDSFLDHLPTGVHVALAGAAVTVALQTGRDTHWILLEAASGERDVDP